MSGDGVSALCALIGHAVDNRGMGGSISWYANSLCFALFKIEFTLDLFHVFQLEFRSTVQRVEPAGEADALPAFPVCSYRLGRDHERWSKDFQNYVCSYHG